MKRVISIILAMLMLTSIVTVAFADSGISLYASQVIDETTIGIRFSSGKVYGMGDIHTVAIADKIGISSIKLYEKNGTKWTQIASSSNKYGYGTNDYGYILSADATAGKQYKVTVSFYGRIGSITDSVTRTKTGTY